MSRRTPRFGSLLVMSTLVVLAACRSEEPKVPPPLEPEPGLEAVDPTWNPESARPAAVRRAGEPKREPKPTAGAKPEFREGMSVEEAIRAVPPEYDYLGIDQEALERPLRDPETFKSCPGFGTQRFSVKVAVWDGKAVGMDVQAPPAMRACIIDKLKQLEWRDKVESINTIEYSQ